MTKTHLLHTLAIAFALTIAACNSQPAAAPRAAVGEPIDCTAVREGSTILISCNVDDVPTVTPQQTEIATETPTATATETLTPTPTDTATNTPTATSTSTSSATNTAQPVATFTPVPQPTQKPVGTPSALTPVCAEHDPSMWHPLYDAANGCRYEHHHGDNPEDPLQCDPLLTQWFGELPTSISYEWQTPNENTLKHDGYINLCRVLQKPGDRIANDLNWAGRTPMVVVGTFLQMHRHAGRMDREKPTHSYRLWTYSCRVVSGAIDWNDCGSFKSGGYAHMGIFHCNYKAKHCARPNDPNPILSWIPGVGMDTSGKSIDPYIAVNKSYTVTLNALRGYPLAWSTSGTLRGDNNQDVWDLWVTGPGIYGKDATGNGYNWNSGFGALSTDDPDSVNPAAYDAIIAAGGTITDAYAAVNISICQFAPKGTFCRFDGSEHAVFTAYSFTPSGWDGSAMDTDGKKDGYVTMNTFADLRGNPNQKCKAASSECVPLILNRSPVGWAGWNINATDHKNGKQPGNLREYNPYNLPIQHGMKH